MKDFASYYDVLRISENASQEEIKKSYRNLVLQFHPDRVSPEAPDLKNLAEEEFKRIQEAYDVLSEPGKRKKYDEELKNLKAGQAANQGGAGGCPLVRLDKNYFKFENLKPKVSVSDILTVFNEGGGVLVGTIIADKPWVKLSETVISTPDYQEIEITIDTTSFSPGFSDSGLIEVETNGGKETVTIDISLELSFLAIFLTYIQPVAKSFWAWVLTTILSILFLISCLIYSCNRSPVINKTSQPEESMAVIPEIPATVVNKTNQPEESVAVILETPTLEDLKGNWFGKIDSSFCFISISPKQDYFEGKLFYQGVIGKIKGKIKDDGEIVFEIENYEDFFNDFIDRKVSFSEFLSSPFSARLKEEKIEASGWKSFSFSKVQTSQWLVLEALISKIEDSDRFKTLKVVYDVEFDKVWEAALKILERRKERIRYENKEERIIITYITEHSSLLGDYAHKYVILFEKEGKTTEFILKLYRYERGVSRNCYSPSSRPIYTADMYFFLSLEKELKRITKKKDIVINRLYFREGFLSKKMKVLTKPIKIMKHRIEEIISLGSVRYVNDE